MVSWIMDAVSEISSYVESLLRIKNVPEGIYVFEATGQKYFWNGRNWYIIPTFKKRKKRC